MSLPRYPAYKPSGIEWLGDVPSHWPPARKLGEVSSLKGRLGWQGLKADEYREEGPFVVSSAHFSDFKIRWDECPRVSQERYEIDDNIQLRIGDTLLMKDGAALGKLAFVHHLPGLACLNSHLLLFRPVLNGSEPTYWHKFAFYYMQTSLFQEYMQTRGTGATFMGVSQDAISRHEVCWPCYSEQRLIATFLDTETAKIDALVEEQRRLIELLKEKRQALISNAVTKGLDPNVPMKDSGVDWLGRIPVHWRVVPIKCVAQVGNGSTPNRDRLDYWEGGHFPWLNSSVVNQGVVVEATQLVSRVALVECHLPVVQPPAVVVGITGEGKTRGMAALLAIEATLNQHLAFVKTVPEIPAAYVRWYFDMAYERMRFESDGGGSTKGAITCAQISNMRIPLPPGPEMLAIVDSLDRTLDGLAELEAQANSAIGLLQERRSALISAAVTGKIDVRGLVPQPEAVAA